MMQYSKLILLVLLLSFTKEVCFGQMSNSPNNYRFAYSADGYNQDRDDVAGSAMAMALFDKAGLSDRVVHFNFNTNFGGKASHASEHRKSVLQTGVLFGMITSENANDSYFDVSESKEERLAAISHLAKQMSRSTIKEPLIVICAGGVQTIYLALEKAIDEGASKESLSSMTFLSHGKANENTARIKSENKDYHNNWASLKTLLPNALYIDHTSSLVNGNRKDGVISSQNSTAWNQSPRNKRKGIEEWKWLNNYGSYVEGFGFSGTKGEWLLTRLKAAGAPEIGHNGNAEGDASDAGMIFGYILAQPTDATMGEIEVFFMGNTETTENSSSETKEEWKPLLDTSLSQWETYLGVPDVSCKVPGYSHEKDPSKSKALGLNNDPLNVFSIETIKGEPILHVTGEVFGGINTLTSYENYHLRMQVRWGEKKYAPRKDSKRDSGVLYHSYGPHGVIGKKWKKCIEYQVQEDDMGDLFALGVRAYVQSEKKVKPGAKRPLFTYAQGEELKLFNGRCAHGVDYDEKPNGEWNTVEIICFGTKAIHLFNGRVVNVLQDINYPNTGKPCSEGSIQIQSEGAELDYRRMEIKSVSKIPKDYQSLFIEIKE